MYEIDHERVSVFKFFLKFLFTELHAIIKGSKVIKISMGSEVRKAAA